jgi:hypothetical protein
LQQTVARSGGASAENAAKVVAGGSLDKRAVAPDLRPRHPARRGWAAWRWRRVRSIEALSAATVEQLEATPEIGLSWPSRCEAGSMSRNRQLLDRLRSAVRMEVPPEQRRHKQTDGPLTGKTYVITDACR